MFNKPNYMVEVHAETDKFPFDLMGMKSSDDSRNYLSYDEGYSFAQFEFNTKKEAERFIKRIEKKRSDLKARLFKTTVEVYFDHELVRQ